MLSGGTENMSQAPHVIRGLRSGLKLNQGKLEDYLYEALLDPYCGLFMAQTAEKCAVKYGISRDEQDEFALRSQLAASKAWADGLFKDEVVPVELKSRRGVTDRGRATITCGRTRRSRAWPSCRRRFPRTAW